MPLKGGLPFYADAGKTETRAYLFASIFRKCCLLIVCFAYGTRRPFGTISSDVKKCRRDGNLGSVCREGGGNHALFRFTSDLVAQLCLKRRLASLSEVENRRKKWLTFDAEVREECGSRVFYFRTEAKLVYLLIVLETFEFCPKPDDTKNANVRRVSPNERAFCSRSMEKVFSRRQMVRGRILSRINTQTSANMVLNESLNSRQRYKSAKTKFRCLFSCGKKF